MESSTIAAYSLQMPEWLACLLTLCGVAEGNSEAGGTAPQSAAAACVTTVLNDPRRRIAVLGGREGKARSLGSVYGGSVTRFLGGFRGGVARVIAMPDVSFSTCNGVAVSHDGSALLVSNCSHDSDAVHLYSVRTGAFVRTIGRGGDGPLRFRHPLQVWVASDGSVFVAEYCNCRIQVLTPRYDFHGFASVRHCGKPSGVCADDDTLIFSEYTGHCLTVITRKTGALVRIGGKGSGDGQLRYPTGICFLPGHRHVAVAEDGNNRVSVFTLDGEFVRHVGDHELYHPAGVACSDAGELVVADNGHKRVVVFNTAGEIAWTSEASAAGDFTGVTMHDSTIFAQTGRDGCVVFA